MRLCARGLALSFLLDERGASDKIIRPIEDLARESSLSLPCVADPVCIVELRPRIRGIRSIARGDWGMRWVSWQLSWRTCRNVYLCKTLGGRLELLMNSTLRSCSATYLGLFCSRESNPRECNRIHAIKIARNSRASGKTFLRCSERSGLAGYSLSSAFFTLSR